MTNESANAAIAEASVTIIKLKPTELTPESWKPYGQVIGPSYDGKLFDSSDAQLNLSQGLPRFYIMRLEDRKSLLFGSITHHASVTQCLGSIGGDSWYMAVAPASILQTGGEPGVQDAAGVNAVRSKAGHIYVPPSPEDVKLFRIDGPRFVKLNAGTWHAGPFFNHDKMDFYNLELSDTNEVDHTTHGFWKQDQVMFKIDDE